MASENNLFIGPALPTGISEGSDLNTGNIVSKDRSSEGVIGPSLPPHLLSKQTSLDEDNVEDNIVDSEEVLQNSSNTYGPALPPHLKKKSIESSDESSESDSDIIGPVPEGSGQQMSLKQQQLDKRAVFLKRKMAEEDFSKKEKITRETWMLELPPEKATNLGLGPRTFRMKAGPDMRDRSDWTDTPADRERKQLGDVECDVKNFKEEMKSVAINERNKVMEQMVDKCKDEKRQLSLLEMHRKKLLKKKKKEKKEGHEKPERRPFDRNIDLQANRFDEAQKKSIFKKAQLLDTRFSQGESKYL